MYIACTICSVNSIARSIFKDFAGGIQNSPHSIIAHQEQTTVGGSVHHEFVTSTTRHHLLSSSNHLPGFKIAFLGLLPQVDLNKSLKTSRNVFYALYWNYILVHYDLYLPCTWCPCNFLCFSACPINSVVHSIYSKAVFHTWATVLQWYIKSTTSAPCP